MRVAILSVALLGFGEYFALVSLDHGHGGRNEFGWVVGALEYGFVALGLNGLAQLDTGERPRDSDDSEPAASPPDE
jgi:hypothetical protein